MTQNEQKHILRLDGITRSGLRPPRPSQPNMDQQPNQTPPSSKGIPLQEPMHFISLKGRRLLPGHPTEPSIQP